MASNSSCSSSMLPGGGPMSGRGKGIAARSAGRPPCSGAARTRTRGRFHNWSNKSLNRQSP
eukprot:5394275-Amphidinium_carterae.1